MPANTGRAAALLALCLLPLAAAGRGLAEGEGAQPLLLTSK